jgi:hypothetical protein
MPDLLEPVLASGHSLLLAHSVTIARNWDHYGFWQLRGIAFWTPPSVEFLDLISRVPYSSFPVGAFLPAFLMAKFAGMEPGLGLFRLWAVINHVALAAACGALAWRWSASHEKNFRAAVATATTLAVLFPPDLNWHFPQTWFGECAAVLPFALSLLFRGPACWAVCFWGAACDPMFFAEATAVRWALGRQGRPWIRWTAECAAPVGLAIGAHMTALFSLLGWAGVQGLFSHAGSHVSSVGATPWDVVRRYKGYLTEAYGWFAWSLLAVPFSRPLLMLGLPPLIHILIWRWHAFNHGFNTVRFAPAVALAVFCVIPMALFRRGSPRLAWSTVVALLALAVPFGVYQYVHVYRPVITAEQRQLVALLQEVGQTAGWNDVLYSDVLQIPSSPEGLTLSVHSKRVIWPLSREKVPGTTAFYIYSQAKGPPVFCKQGARLFEGFAYCRAP